MIRRHVLAALARGVEAADEDVARDELARIDWVLRGAARRRLEHALIDASLATGALDATPPSQRLRLQAAALIVSGQEVGDPAPAYARLVQRPPLRVPIATICALAVAAVACTAVVAATVHVATTAQAGSFTRPTPPPPVGVFRDGGAPRRDAAIEQVLAVELPALISHPSSDPAGRRAKVDALREHAAFASRGGELQVAWRRMIDAVDRWLDPEAASNVAELRARIFVVSDQLAAAELGYYLEPALADRHRRRPGIYTYRIDEVGFVRANDDRMRVLGVRRLDHLDDGMAALGLANEELDDPVVLLDQIDVKVVRDVMPVLAGRDYALGDDAWRTRGGRAAMTAAADGIRRELATALGADQTPDAARARIAKLLTASVRHHEAQHGLDHDRDLAHPSVLASAIGGSPDHPFSLRARHELSAYLSQIASDMWIPQLVLWNLSRHAFSGYRGRKVEEAYVAAIVVEQIAAELHIRAGGPVITSGGIDRDRLVALVGPIAARSTAEIRTAAAAAWTRLFERRLPRIVDR